MEDEQTNEGAGWSGSYDGGAWGDFECGCSSGRRGLGASFLCYSEKVFTYRHVSLILPVFTVLSHFCVTIVWGDAYWQGHSHTPRQGQGLGVCVCVCVCAFCLVCVCGCVCMWLPVSVLCVCGCVPVCVSVCVGVCACVLCMCVWKRERERERGRETECACVFVYVCYCVNVWPCELLQHTLYLYP